MDADSQRAMHAIAGRLGGGLSIDREHTGQFLSDKVKSLETKVERLTEALGLLRGHVVDDEGWKLINDALWLGPRDENDEPIYPDRKATP